VLQPPSSASYGTPKYDMSHP